MSGGGWTRLYSRAAYERDRAAYSRHVAMRDPAWITSKHAAELLDMHPRSVVASLKGLLPHRLLEGIPHVSGRPPTMFRREDVERIKHVHEAADISLRAAIKVVAAEVAGKL